MHIAVLMGSPRKKDSYRICKCVEEQVASIADVTFQYLFLSDYRIEDCRGCKTCFQRDALSCPCRDDLPALKEKLLQADGIIFSSPVYACQISGSLKRVIDRLAYLFHRQELAGKPALTVATTDGGGQRPTLQYLKMTACGWGCHLAGEICVVSPRFFKSGNADSVWGYHPNYHTAKLLEIQKTAGAFAQAVLSGRPAVPTFYEIFLFQCLRSKTWFSAADHRFWKERGWLESDYFYDARLNPAKLIFARLMRAYVASAARKLLKAANRGPTPPREG